jgi:predicted transcriptional regulator
MQSIQSAMKTMLRAAAYRRARVLALRSAGHTYTEIARLLGVSRQRAHQIVKASNR